LVTAKLCQISSQNTKYTKQIMISISFEVFDCYTKFIATLQLTIRLGSVFKHQKVLLYNGGYVPIFWRNVLPSSSINIYSDGGGSFFSETSVHTYLTTNRHRPEDSCLQSWRLEPENYVLYNGERVDTESAEKLEHYESYTQ